MSNPTWNPFEDATVAELRADQAHYRRELAEADNPIRRELARTDLQAINAELRRRDHPRPPASRRRAARQLRAAARKLGPDVTRQILQGHCPTCRVQPDDDDRCACWGVW